MRIHIAPRRLALVLGLAFGVLLVPFAAPIGIAQACGCGAYSPAEGGTARVPRETALVRVTDDGTEDIYVALTLDSDVRTGALLFPVPTRNVTVSTGPRTLFDTLNRITAPPAQTRAPGSVGNGAGAPAPGVTVENRQAIGPLDVVTLSSNDPAALTAWLSSNGFTAKPALTRAARPYTDEGWAFVAVRLRPEAAATTALDGQLDPLHLRFRSLHAVYPMRLSALASAPEQVTVYALATRPQKLYTQNPGMRLTDSTRINPVAHPDLGPVMTGDTTYLTRYDGTLTPATITDDFRFESVDVTPGPSDSITDFASPAYSDAAKPELTSSSDSVEIATAVLGIVAVLGLMAAGVVIHYRRTASGQHR